MNYKRIYGKNLPPSCPIIISKIIILMIQKPTLLCSVLVQSFNSVVVPQQIQNIPVCFPQELYPWCQKHSVCSILSVFNTNTAQQKPKKRQVTSVLEYKFIHSQPGQMAKRISLLNLTGLLILATHAKDFELLQKERSI